MCKYCDEHTEKSSYSDIIEGRVDFGFYGDMLVGLTIIPERASLELALSNYGDKYKIFKAKIRYCPFCGRELKNGAVL